MTKSDVIKGIREKVDISYKDCAAVLDAMLEEIFSSLDDDGKYTQSEFGTFDTHTSKERIGINPFTKQKMRYPKKRKMRFKPAKLFKDTLNA